MPEAVPLKIVDGDGPGEKKLAEYGAGGTVPDATVVNHIVPHQGDAKRFRDVSNWQALCEWCHNRKTMTVDRLRVRG